MHARVIIRLILTSRALWAGAVLLMVLPGIGSGGDGRQLAREGQERLALAQADDPHAHHRHRMESKGYTRSTRGYQPPPLPFVDMDGNPTTLARELDCGKPVMLNFIFTTCTTICPLLSATFAQVQKQLGSDIDAVRMISISIDPEYDTPQRLRAYAKRFGAGPQWRFFTGETGNIIAAQRAFAAYRGSKMNHEPVTFLRVSAGAPWVRLDGIASASDVMREYRRLQAP